MSVSAGAELEVNGPMTSSGLGGDGSVRLGTGSLTLNVAEGVFTSFNGTITTTGGVFKNGLGTQAFAGANSFSGGLTLNAGVLQTNGDAGLGVSGGFVRFNGGTLRWGLPFDVSSTRPIELQSGGGGFDVSIYTTTLAQNITGGGALKKLGIGILSLTGTNSFTGGIQVENGILVGNAASLPGDIHTLPGTILHIDQNTDSTWTGGLSGGGAVEVANQSGFGVLRMTEGRAHTNTGTTFVGTNVFLVAPTTNGTNAFSAASAYTVDGALDLSSFTQTIGSLAGSGQVYSFSLVGATGTLVLGGNGSNTTFSGLIKDNTGSIFDNGRLAVVKQGAGNFRPTGTNTFSGGLTVNAGFVEFSTAANLGTGDITLNGGGLRWLPGSNTDISARLQPLGPNGGIIDLGSGNVTFATAPTGSGKLTVQSDNNTGTLSLNSVLRHTGGLELAQAGVSIFDNADSTYAGDITGHGAFTKNGSGTLTLTGANTFTGLLFLNSGTLVVSATSMPSVQVSLNNATLMLDQDVDRTFSGLINGNGSSTFVKTGAGTLTLTNTNSLFGITQVLGGMIEIGVQNGFNANVYLDGAGIRWGAGVTSSPGFTTFGANGATLDTNGNDILLPGDFYGNGAFIKNGAGRLTLPGRTSIAGNISVNGGVLAGGSGTFNQATMITLAAGTQLLLDQAGVQDHVVQISSVQGAGDVRVANSGTPLAVLRHAPAALFTHTGATQVDANTAFVLSAANVLSSSSGLTLNGILDLGGFAQTISKLSGGGQIYSAGSSSAVVTLTVAQNSDSTFSGAFSDTVLGFQGITALRKTGTGTLTLSSASTHSGGVTVSGGRIDFSHNAALGSGTLTLDGGAVRWTGAGNATLGNTLSVTSNGGTLDAGAGSVTLSGFASNEAGVLDLTKGTLILSGTSSYAGIISGAGALGKTGPGTLTLSGGNTFTGGVTINGGFIEFSTGSLGTTGAITLDGGGLKWAAGNTSDVSARFAPLTSGGVVFDSGGNNVTLLTPLTGSGPVTKDGAGTLTLTDVLLRSSHVTITAGTLNARNDTDLTYSGHISGAGTFMKSGAGTLVLGTGQSIGSTVITGGLIEFSMSMPDTFGIGSAITLDGGGLKWANGLFHDASPHLAPLGSHGGVIDTNGNSINLSSTISGSGPLIKQGAGTLTLGSTENTFTGGVIVRGGMLDPFRPESLGTSSITLDGGALRLQDGFPLDLSTRLQPLGPNGGIFETSGGGTTFATPVTGTGSLTKRGAGTLMLTGLAHTGGTTVLSGALVFSSTAELGTGNITLDGGGLRWSTGSTVSHAAQFQIGTGGGTLDTGSGDVTFTTATSGIGAFTKDGTGTLKLTGFGHGGGTSISGSLELQISTDSSYAGAISGGALVKSGAGTLALTSMSTSLSSLTVTAGLVEFAGGSTLGSITLNGGGLRWAAGNTFDISSFFNPLGTGGTLDTGDNDVTLLGNIGGGALIKRGTGTLSLKGANTFTSLIVQQGFVEIGGLPSMGSGTVTLDGGGLRWQQSVAVDVSSRLAPIGANGAILDTGANNILASTTLTGTGILVKAGTGRLILTELMHTGGTHAAEGTLEAQITTNTTTRLTGSGIFVKHGSGVLTLDAGSFHTGVTSVTQGSLIVNGYNLATTTVQNGATLGGSGVLGYVTLQNGATLAPGNSPGTLTLASDADGSFDFQAGSSVQMEITLGGGPSDLLNFIGNGNSTLSFLSSLTITANTLLPTEKQTFNLLDWSGLISAPTFASHFSQNTFRDGSQDNGSAWDLPDISVSGFTWDLSQFTTNGTIQIVPEPRRTFLLLSGAGVMLRRRRRAK